MTTRNPECRVYNNVGGENLGDLEPELACKLLLRAAFIEERQWEEKKEAAMSVVRILGSHTLAIIQAGAFIRQGRCSLEMYLDRFQQQQQRSGLLKISFEAKPVPIWQRVRDFRGFRRISPGLTISRTSRSFDATAYYRVYA